MSLPRHRNQPKLLGHLIRRGLLVAVLLAGAEVTGWTSYAAVPVSVAVRQQSPEVETIIKAMEAKVTAMDGTWVTRSGVQDAAADEWETGIKGGHWSWASTAKAPSPLAGMIFYDDGEDGYLLAPAAKNNAGGATTTQLAQRLQNDSIHQGLFADYRRNGYLLHLNLLPQQLLGSLAGLRIIGQEKLGDSSVIHLQMDTTTDPLSQKETAIPLNSHTNYAMELYYNPQRKAIEKVVVYQGNTQKQVLTVTAWDQFGTSESWPKQITVQIVRDSDKIAAASKTPEKPYLTSVMGYTADHGAKLDAVQKQISQVPYFATPASALRTSAFYEQSLKQQDRLSDRVDLAQAYLAEGNLKGAMEQWNKVEAQLTPEYQKQLSNKLMYPALGLLRTAAHKQDQIPDCVALIKRINTTVSGDQYRNACPALFSAWQTWHQNPQNRALADSLNTDLLPKFEQYGQAAVYRGMLTLVKAKKDDQILLDPYLDRAAQAPLPAAGYKGSQLSIVVMAALQTQDYARAKKYLSQASWHPETPESAKAISKALLNVTDLAPVLANQAQGKWSEAINLYQQLSTKPLTEDALDAAMGKSVLVNSAVTGLDLFLKSGDHGEDLASALAASSKQEGADRFWGELLATLWAHHTTDPTWLLKNVDPLTMAYAKAFNHPEYPSQTWLQLARDNSAVGKLLNIQVERINKALAKAPDDAWRVQAIMQLANSYAQVREFTKGIDAVRGAGQLVTKSEMVKQVDSIVKSLERQQKQDQERVIQEQLGYSLLTKPSNER